MPAHHPLRTSALAGDVADAIRAVAGDDVVDDAIDEVESAS